MLKYLVKTATSLNNKLCLFPDYVEYELGIRVYSVCFVSACKRTRQEFYPIEKITQSFS